MGVASDLRRLDDTALGRRLAEAQEELFNLRFQLATGQLDNVSRIKAVRRDVARIHTIIREREIESAEELAREQRS
jgi:large subunit ribosomal protein L29